MDLFYTDNIIMKKSISIFFICIIVCVGAFIVYYTLRPASTLSASEKKAAVEQMLGRGVKNPSSGSATDHQYKGKYISYTYPATAEPYKNPNNANADSLELAQFQEHGTHLFFTATVSDGGSVSSFADISGVVARGLSGSGYSKTQGVIGGQPALLFTKSGDEFEKTGFVIANNRVYTFAVTGASESSVSETFALIAKTAVLH